MGTLHNVSRHACCRACDAAPNGRCELWVYGPSDIPSDGSDCWLMNQVPGLGPSPHRVAGRRARPPSPPGNTSSWSALGTAADVYLAVAPTGRDFGRALYELSGTPAMPPRWALGFIASWWGYRTLADVHSNMSAFRDGKYPIDTFIMDYDWFQCGTSECYGAVCYNPPHCPPPALNGNDFGYNPYIFSSPKEQLQHIHDKFHLRFGGIRKPRVFSVSHRLLANQSGWLLPLSAGPDNLNFSDAAMRAWSTEGNAHFLSDGVDLWWNDEGETQFFTYEY